MAVREFKMKENHGFADYLLFVVEKPVGVVEAKAAGHTLSGVQVQARKYSDGLPDVLSPPLRPLPFIYSSTGVETLFVNLLDPEPRRPPLGRLPPARHACRVARREDSA